MELVLASNFDDALVDGSRDLPVSTFFGNFPVTLTGGGRPPRILPAVSPERFRSHLAAVHATGREFYATLNSNDLGLREYTPEFRAAFRAEVDELLDLGVDGFVVALPLLVELIRADHPEVPISVSTFARIRTATQADYYLDLGADTIVLEEANRDFPLLKALVRRGARVEVLVNQSCLQGCPFRGHHLNTSSLAAQPGNPCPEFEYPIAECGREMLRDPSRLVSSILVRPEDLSVYEAAGVSRFKVSGRNHATPWLLRAARAYAGRSYPGDLLDIVSFVQVRGPLGYLTRRAAEHPDDAVAVAWRDAYARLAHVSIDNRRFPAGFLATIAKIDCEHRTCAECGFCARVARDVLRIDGRPLADYAPPDLGRPLADLLPGGPMQPVPP